MDAYQQQPPRYMRPPPPPAADPHLLYHQQYHHQPPRAPPPQGPWYSNQFQYQHHQSQSSPSPPPPAPSQWGPPPLSDHSAYPPPPPLPYPAHLHNATANNHFPPPPPPPPPPPHPPLPYPHQVNQEWSNPNWSHHQGWDYSAHNNVEDWGAKAREWANARAAMQEQHPQTQFTPVGRPEDQNRFHDQFPQAVDCHYLDGQQKPLPTSSYQQFPVPAVSPHRPPLIYPQETLPSSSGPPSYLPEEHLPYHVRDGTSAADSKTGFLHQQSLPTTSSVHQQEVPSSYSSVSGKEDSAEQKDQSYKSILSAEEAQHNMQPLVYGNQAIDPTTDLSDRPLDFVPRFNGDHDPHMQSGYASHHDPMGNVRGIDPVAAVPSMNSWTQPVAPPVVYPQIPPVLPSGSQHDPSMVVPPLPGHATSTFGRFPAPSFQPTAPSANTPFGLGTGASLHPAAAFPGDTYGTVSERPKKAPVPNWLKEEIIKNKAALSKSSLEHPKDETNSAEDEGIDKSFGKGDQADSKSIDSSRSMEEEDDDEDYVEAARAAAINQEIKRVLTEVLLKVTDELFDEIATKVLSEDEPTIEVDQNTVRSDHKLSPSSSAVPTSKATARVLVPGKATEPDTIGVSEKSSSSSPGDILGLSNYASDDEDDEIQSSRIPNSRNNVILPQSRFAKLSKDKHDVSENGNSQVDFDGQDRVGKNLGSDLSRSKNNNNASDTEFIDNGGSSKMTSGDEINANSRKVQDESNFSGLKNTLGEKSAAKSELSDKNVGKKLMKDDFLDKETRHKSNKNDRHESRKSSSVKDSGKEQEIGRVREFEKGDENRQRQDERHPRKEKVDDRNGSKERSKEFGVKTGEKAKESESRKRSNHFESKDEMKDTERSHRASVKEDVNRKREQAKEEEGSRHKLGSDSSGNKRRRSSSASSRGRSSKDNLASHSNVSSDEASDESRRNLHSRKRDLSPSPVRSRRRQVSRSPRSKHSQRRHSPYSSLETIRGRRSRSRSPARRQR